MSQSEQRPRERSMSHSEPFDDDCVHAMKAIQKSVRGIFAPVSASVCPSGSGPYPPHLQRLAASAVYKTLEEFDQDFGHFLE